MRVMRIARGHGSDVKTCTDKTIEGSCTNILFETSGAGYSGMAMKSSARPDHDDAAIVATAADERRAHALLMSACLACVG